jgi:hypothetical protein
MKSAQLVLALINLAAAIRLLNVPVINTILKQEWSSETA